MTPVSSCIAVHIFCLHIHRIGNDVTIVQISLESSQWTISNKKSSQVVKNIIEHNRPDFCVKKKMWQPYYINSTVYHISGILGSQVIQPCAHYY